jgi:hypothetical protein
MKSHPCLNCPAGDKDKNNRTCMQCAKRIQYVVELDKELHFSLCNTTGNCSQPRRSSCTQISRLLATVTGIY